MDSIRGPRLFYKQEQQRTQRAPLNHTSVDTSEILSSEPLHLEKPLRVTVQSLMS